MHLWMRAASMPRRGRRRGKNLTRSARPRHRAGGRHRLRRHRPSAVGGSQRTPRRAQLPHPPAPAVLRLSQPSATQRAIPVHEEKESTNHQPAASASHHGPEVHQSSYRACVSASPSATEVALLPFRRSSERPAKRLASGPKRPPLSHHRASHAAVALPSSPRTSGSGAR